MATKKKAIRESFVSLLVLGVLTVFTATGYLKEMSPATTRSSTVVNPAPVGERRTRTQGIAENYGKLPLIFEVNQGQTDPSVKFVSRGSGYNLYLTPTEAVLTLRKENTKPKTLDHQPAGRVLGALDSRDRLDKERMPAEMTTVRMKLVGGRANAEVMGVEQQSARVNYFIGNDPKKWRRDVPTYARVQYKDIYPGVDLACYGRQRQLEYDFVVKPGADPNQIRLGFKGAKKIRVDESGDLVLTTKGGEVRQHKPVVYQEVAGSRKEIAGSYVVQANGEVGFEIGSYDTSQPLVIDPVLSYSTYLGGAGSDVGYGIAVDSAGNAYVTGETASANFPTMNAYQPSIGNGGQSGETDAFITKLTPSGGLSYSTFLGGNISGSSTVLDAGYGIAVDSAGNAYVTGETYATNFPTLNAYQPSNGGGNAPDAFVTKLTASGGLNYSTYLGGNSDDFGRGIAVDSAGNFYVIGITGSSNFPTLDAYQSSFGGETRDAFVTKFSAAGGLSYSTYLGGNNYDFGEGIAVDSASNAYVTGYTFSTNFPTLNAYQGSHASGAVDAFVTKLTVSGALSYSTYLGGTGTEVGQSIAADSAGNTYVTGYTLSTDFPTLNAYQVSHAPDSSGADAFVTRLTVSGGLSYSTYLGGNSSDQGHGIATDSAGNAYVTGVTSSTNFPTLNASQPSNGGGSDAFVTKLTASGGLSYSTYLGGNSIDFGHGIAADSSGNAYVTGTTSSSSFPTLNASQSSNGGGADAFVTKLGSDGPVVCDGQNFNNDYVLPILSCTGGPMLGITWIPVTTQTISRIEIFTGFGGGTRVPNRLAIWSDDGGSPTKPLATLGSTCAFNVVPTNSWQGADLTTLVNVVAGQKYWVVWDPDVNQTCSSSTDPAGTHLAYWASSSGTVDGGASWIGPFGQPFNNQSDDRWKFRMFCGSGCPSCFSISGNVPDFCDGVSQAINLTLTGANLSGATINWSLSGPSPNANLGVGTNLSITLSGLTAGNYTITATTTESGCPAAAVSKTFTVTASPTCNFVSAPTTTNVNTAVTFSATSVSGANYSWSVSGVSASPSSQNGASNSFTFTPTTTGTATVNLIVTKSGCSSSCSTTLSVVQACPSNGIINGTVADFCESTTQAVSLSASGSNLAGATITWKLDGTTTLGTGTSLSTTLSGIPPGTHAIALTASKSGCPDVSASTSFTVKVKPTITISGAPAGEICPGITINLMASASPSGGTVVFLWTKNGNFFSNTAAITDTPSVGTTTYAVTVTRDGCASDAAQAIVTVGDHLPPVIADMSAQTRAYVVNAGANNVSVINTATNTVVTTIPVGRDPFAVTCTPDGTRAYVSVSNDNKVLVIDTATNSAVSNIPVGAFPTGVVITPDGSRAYVTNFSSNNVSVINTSTNAVVATISVGSSPLWVALKPDGSRAYVTNELSSNISVIDTATNTVVATVTVPPSGLPQWVAVAPDGTRAYVTVDDSMIVSVIDTSTNTVVASVPVGINPRELAITPDGTRVYVTNLGSGTVSVINTATNTVVVTIPVGALPLGVAITPDGSRAYVTNAGANTVSVIDTATNTVVAAVAVGSSPFGVAIASLTTPIVASANSNCQATIPNVIPGFSGTDNCSSTVLTQTPTAGAMVGIGPHSITVTATDAAGNTSTTTTTFTVIDNSPPLPNVATLPTITGECSATVTSPTATDNCAGQISGTTNDPTSYSNQGTFTLHWTYDDGHGNSSTQTQTVIVHDASEPTINCPVSITKSTDPGQCSAVTTYTAPAASDNCAGVGAPVCNPPSGSTFPKGATTVTCTVVDASGNPSSCSFTITVNDNQAPTITCPSSITTGAAANQCYAVVSYATNSSDNCPSLSSVCNPPSGATFPKGTTAVNCTATDSSGNTASCAFTVTVVDTQPPTIVCPANLSATATTGQVSTVVSFSSPAVTDNCPGASVVCSPPSGSTFPLGVTTVTCTATDSSANQATCAFKVAVSGTLLAAADSFVRDGADNTNEGANERLRIQSSGNNRALASFNLSGISTTGLQSATLVLNIAENSNNWGTGRAVEAHRLLADWTEGNGRNDVMVGGGPGFRGTGEGVTWKCAKDTNINNQNDDCTTPWNGGTFAVATAPSNLHTNNQTGDVTWDVTADVQAGANYGWLIKKQAEGQNGQVRYYSREGAAQAGNPSLAPRLVLVYQP